MKTTMKIFIKMNNRKKRSLNRRKLFRVVTKITTVVEVRIKVVRLVLIRVVVREECLIMGVREECLIMGAKEEGAREEHRRLIRIANRSHRSSSRWRDLSLWRNRS